MSNADANLFGTGARAGSDHEVALLASGPGAAAAELVRLYALAREDAAVAMATGRWVLGRADPDRYVPGDVVAVRAFAVTADLDMAARYLERATDGSMAPEHTEVAARRMAAIAADVGLLFRAVPHFVDAPAAAGLLASEPPGPDVLAELRLPHPAIAVFFGRPLPLDPAGFDWPPSWDHHRDLAGQPTTLRTSLGDLRQRGGCLDGVVLCERPGGGLGDEVLWVVGAEPDRSRPEPLCHDRMRALVWGRLSAAGLAPVATNLAATVAWAEWHEPKRSLRLPDEVGSRPWRRAARSGAFRRHEPRGALAGVRVLDLGRSLAPDLRGDSAVPGRSPATHLRRAHWRLQPVGPGRRERKVVRVAATVVNAGRQDPGRTVHRVASPDNEPPAPAEPDVLDLRRIDLRLPDADGLAGAGPPRPACPDPHPPLPEVSP